MRKLGLGLDNKAFWTPSAVEDCAGSVIDTDGSSPQYTSSTILGGPRFQEGTRSAKDKLERYSQHSRKICEEWDLPGKRRRWQLLTDKNGVGVWPNTFTWTWDESSQVKSRVLFRKNVGPLPKGLIYESSDWIHRARTVTVLSSSTFC